MDPPSPPDEHNRLLQSHVHPLDWVNPIPNGRYNLVVIGAGTAGLVTAAGAAGLGAKVAIIEKNFMGGDCLNVGCVPSKAIISAARRVADVRDAESFGVRLDSSPRVDFAATMERMRRLRASISPHDSARRFAELGVDVFFGQGSFISTDTIEVGGQTLKFQKAVIATGTRPADLPVPGFENLAYLTNETIFSLTALPRRLTVIGGGPIGCELAQSFARFGSIVTLVEASGQILPREEPDAVEVVQRSMAADGVRFLFHSTILRAQLRGTEKVIVLVHAGIEQEVAGDEILVCVGRMPNVNAMGLDRVGVAVDSITGIKVNDRLQTTNSRIYAAGDICSKYKFTHAADFLARIAVQNALFMGRARVSKLIVPWCTYTSPELAHVGLYPREAAERGIDLLSFTQAFSSVDRAVLESQDTGFLRLHCRKGSDRILGATIVSERAGDLIGAVTLAFKNGVGLKRIAATIHPYPTQAEALQDWRSIQSHTIDSAG